MDEQTLQAPRWVKIDHTHVLKVWELEKNVWPEIALLRVPHQTYLKFFESCDKYMDFLNSNRIFSKDVILIGPWVTVSSVVPNHTATDWVLMMMHGKQSTVATSAIPSIKLE